MNGTIKRIALLALPLAVTAAAAAFDWPVKNLDAEQNIMTFGQNRKNAFNASLTFPNAEAAEATDNGMIIGVISEHQGDGDWFESPLGNALIVSHDDELVSIYGNLSSQSAIDLQKVSNVKYGEVVGQIARSAWSQDPEEEALEFQISDSRAKTYLNPTILMSRAVKPKRLRLENISIENQFGRLYAISNLRSVPAGRYKVYKKRQSDTVAFKSEVYVNGSELDKITKDTIKNQDGVLRIIGSDAYSSEDFYPSEDLELLGRIFLPHGSNTVTITVYDIFNNASRATYNISGY